MPSERIRNLTQSMDYAGTITRYSYDNMDRMVKKSVGGKVTEYSYDKKGLLQEVTDPSGTVKYRYDPYDRLVKKTDVNGAVLSYTYDKAGRLETFDNGFGKTSYEYDLLDRVTRVVDRNGKATVYEYDAAGNRSAVRYPNGTVMSYTYDACQRLKEEWVTDAKGVILAKYSYGLGKAGERLSVTETDASGETETTYGYDKLNRLVKEVIAKNGSELTNEYGYDKVSNRISKETKVKGSLSELADTASQEVQVKEGRTTYTYNALNQLVTEKSSEGSITYTYDANGNLIKQSDSKNVDYSYDKENHLLRATIQQGNSVTVESYTYDYAGNRLSKTVNESDTVCYVNDTSGSLTQVVAETDQNGKETAFYTRSDELLSMEREGSVWYYIYDGHGNTRLLTNAAGTVTDRYAYDACGNLLQKEGETENDFLYTGEQYNANTGLYYLRARYMDPSTGTFISMDSYQGSLYDPVSLHKYLYANANPVKYTDPTGYYSLVDMSVGMAGTSILAGSVCLMYINLVKNLKDTIYQSEAQSIAANNIAFSLTSGICDWIIDYSQTRPVDNIVEVVREIVEDKVLDQTKPCNIYTVYTLKDGEGNVRYVGRTKNYEKRMTQHGKADGVITKYNLSPYNKFENLTYAECRGIEQTLMIYYHSRLWKGESGYNKINGIAEKNPKKELYYQDTLTYFENQKDNEYLCILENLENWWK